MNVVLAIRDVSLYPPVFLSSRSPPDRFKSMEDTSEYSHSPAHLAVARRDHDALRRLVASLPTLPKPEEVTTEEESLASDAIVDAVSAVIDCRDVPGRETPLFLAIKLRDPISADILMSAGADWSIQNDKGWSAFEEAMCTCEESIVKIAASHYGPFIWDNWCRRLPRIVSSLKMIRDFYMEVTFYFESSVAPFITKVAPSDTYRIWKRGPNLRIDMTLDGYDGFKIQRRDQTCLFLGEGAPAGGGHPALPTGSALLLDHKDKEITNAFAFDGSGWMPTEAEIACEAANMSQHKMYRPEIDVAQAELVPHLNWRRQERMEMVGNWKAKVYNMVHVMVSLKWRRVGGVTTNEKKIAEENEKKMANGGEFDDILDLALRLVESEGNGNACELSKNTQSNGTAKDKKSWFGWSNKNEREFKRGLRPIFWLTHDFPLKTDELVPLLDVLANKMKAVRQLREILTAKLPPGTFPVKIAIPIVPTIRVTATFTKFEELQPVNEFATPLSRPNHFQESKSKELKGLGSWYSRMRGTRPDSLINFDGPSSKEEVDPFHIPSDYIWVAEQKR